MDFSVIMQYISYLLVAIGVMAFLVSAVTQVVKSWPGLDKLPTSVVVIVLSLVLCPVTFVALCVYDRGLYRGAGGYGWMGTAQRDLGPDRLPEKRIALRRRNRENLRKW